MEDIGKNVTMVRFRVTTRSKKPGVKHVMGDAVKVALSSAPTDDIANCELRVRVADLFNVKPAAVVVSDGLHSRNKSGVIVHKRRTPNLDPAVPEAAVIIEYLEMREVASRLRCL